MFTDSDATMGAIASKKKRCSEMVNSPNALANAGEVKGPDAIIVGPAGIKVTSWRTILIFGQAEIFSVTRAEKAVRSTARAPPAGSAEALAHSNNNDPRISSSVFKWPWARSAWVEPNELEQTTSARESVR